MIGLKDVLQASSGAALTKFVTIKAPLVFCGKFSGKFGNFLWIRGKIVFYLQNSAKLCNAILVVWVGSFGIL